MFPTRLLLITALASSFSIAYADESVQQVLDRMNNTLEMSNYQGTFVFMNNGSVETMRIIHSYSSDGVKEKLVSLTGDAREVIRNQDVLTFICPLNKIDVYETAIALHAFHNLLQDKKEA